ncbi:NAD(P)-binding protein [Mycena latifolia]|nr:NAD(P)-binding protein [Mycena latifolia]
MTITQNLAAPLVAVVGATGYQGGSVIKALEESDKAYRIRAFTRVDTKPSAQQLVEKGVEVVKISLVIENTEEVHKAFAGANMAFIVTNFNEHLDMEKELSEGKMLLDAAKAAGASRVVWSGLASVSKISGQKFVHGYHFDSKAAVTDYGRQTGVPFVDVQAGFYASNILEHNKMMLTKQDDGTFTLEWPTRPTTVVPLIDVPRDYGLYVRHVLELPVFPVGAEVLTGQNITIQDLTLQLSQATGKKIAFKQISSEEYENKAQKLGVPPHFAEDLRECFQCFDEFGYYGAKPTASLDGLARKPHTWTEFVQTADWSKVLA